MLVCRKWSNSHDFHSEVARGVTWKYKERVMLVDGVPVQALHEPRTFLAPLIRCAIRLNAATDDMNRIRL